MPKTFRREPFFAFHQRDGQACAERVQVSQVVDKGQVDKGIMWNGFPARLTISLGDGMATARIKTQSPHTREQDNVLLDRMARRMLGLTQPIEAFEALARQHPTLGRLVEAQSGLRVPVAATPFEALSWAITGQQISVAVAVSLRRKLIRASHQKVDDDLFCYPGPEQLASFDPRDLRALGFSSGKAHTLVTVARLVASGVLPLDAWLTDGPASDMESHLLSIKGIGPWTVSYTLLRGYGWLDGSLHGDVAVRKALQRLLGQTGKISPQDTADWLGAFRPWRALAAAHLWASFSKTEF